ncbi:hypothetical protein Tco_0894713 [Tanacetum coccineum]|uniref:Uncharacterized protein n=1 Tax=Tanacetum coccineum TaxID=301880 RepID=A0ABQ5CCH8_9ASTR
MEKNKAHQPDEPSEEPEDPLIMGEDELSTIPEKDKSNIPITSLKIDFLSEEFAVILHSDSTRICMKTNLCCEKLSVMRMIFVSDDDYFENIDYVEASPPDSELVSLKEVEDVILRDKLSNVYLLISKIEALNDNPILSSFSYSDNSFSDHTEETGSGSTISHADISLRPEYDSFLF